MNKREAERLTRQMDTLQSLGFTRDESDKLRRISMTLQRWHELECGTGEGQVSRSVERDDNGEGKPFMRVQYPTANGYHDKRYPIADRERGALKRLAAILAARNSHRPECNMLMPIQPGKIAEHAPCSCGGSQRAANPLKSYIQGDPRGAALYILRPGDVPAGSSVDSCYSRGISVY